MEICIFYSWQNMYRDNCDKIISSALKKAVKELNAERKEYHYYIERGGGGIIGDEHIDNNIDNVIRYKADIAIVDFTHNGNIPQQNPETGKWIKEKCSPNANANNEHGRLVGALDEKQVFKVYNTAYGEMDVNLEPPFDLRQSHYPVSFYCVDETSSEERVSIKNKLTKEIKARIKDCTEAFIVNQKVRYAPLVPMRNEYEKKLYNSPFKKTETFGRIREKLAVGHSFRLLGLPGLGKTRMIGEAFRGQDNDVYYCDCRDQPKRDVTNAVEMLMKNRGNTKQIVVLDNCDQRLCGVISDMINESGFNCQLITIYYDSSERSDSGIDSMTLKVDDFAGVVEDMVEHVNDMSKEDQETIINLAGGFPLMAAIMIENYHKGTSIVNISKKDVFERMLGIDSNNAIDQDKLRVMTAFSIFKFIGLYGVQEKQGRFIANNKIITNIHGTEEENLQLFREVYGQYQHVEILERQGNLVLMRLIPLAIYLCKVWFDKQTSDSVGDLIDQIRNLDDEGTKKMLIESLSRRITLLSDVTLAKELNDGLTNPDNSPFLTEEVVLSALGSRLFLAFSEVNPESCALALYKMIETKSDEDILNIEPARRNLAWALDHLAFDKRSFRYAMLTLARLSLVETEEELINNTTGLFLDRFAILLSGTEVNLISRVELLKELSTDSLYRNLVKQSLLAALHTGHFYRSGSAEKQGMRRLKDYVPSLQEVMAYYNTCFDMLLELSKTLNNIEEIAKVLADNARGYYLQGAEVFLFRVLEIIAPIKKYAWEDMKENLSYLLDFDVKKRNGLCLNDIAEWKKKLTKEDYVYTLLHLGNEISRHSDFSFETEVKKTNQLYGDMARELVDKKLYKKKELMSGIMTGNCFYYNSYGATLSLYSKEVGTQKNVLDILLDHVINQEVSRDGESLLIYFILNVEDRLLLEHTYDVILNSKKKRLLPSLYAIKAEGDSRLAQLFVLLDNGDLTLNDFNEYFNYRILNDFNVKYVSRHLLDYGAEGAVIVLSHCYNLLFSDKNIDTDYQDIGKRCLMLMDLKGIQQNDYIYMESMNNYLAKHHDNEMALHIHKLQEKGFGEHSSRNNYYIGRLYRKVLRGYSELLIPRLFELLEDQKVRHLWIDLMRSSYPQDKGEEEPMYTIIPIEQWFEWLNKSNKNECAYSLAMIFRFSNESKASLELLKLLNEYWCYEVEGALSSRFHSFSWFGSGIPLYQSRIMLCKDYISKLTNQEAKEWFKKDIDFWENEIENENLRNAHERAIYE